MKGMGVKKKKGSFLVAALSLWRKSLRDFDQRGAIFVPWKIRRIVFARFFSLVQVN